MKTPHVIFLVTAVALAVMVGALVFEAAGTLFLHILRSVPR